MKINRNIAFIFKKKLYVRGVIPVRVLQVHASRICDDMIAHESNVAVLRRFDNVGLADDSRGSSSLRANAVLDAKKMGETSTAGGEYLGGGGGRSRSRSRSR